MGDSTRAARIHDLLVELRTWGPAEVRFTVVQLAERYGLEPVEIQQIARSEGLHLRVGEVGAPDPGADVDATTEPIDV